VIHLQEFVDEFCLGHSLSICRDPLELGAKAIGHIVERLFERALSLSLGTAALRVHEAALIILLMAVFIEYNCDINAFYVLCLIDILLHQLRQVQILLL
jgi:hypothetical protein